MGTKVGVEVFKICINQNHVRITLYVLPHILRTTLKNNLLTGHLFIKLVESMSGFLTWKADCKADKIIEQGLKSGTIRSDTKPA